MFFPRRCLGKRSVYPSPRVGAWYWIGVAAGIGAAIGALAPGLLRDVRLALPVAIAAAGGAGYFVADVAGAIAGGAGALLAVVGVHPVVRGALARGGAPGGTALLVGGAAVAIAALAFVPALGYILPLALLPLGLRARRRAGERYAGLRILARD